MPYKTDHLGFLSDAKDWDEDWAENVAERLSLNLEPLDLAIIESLRSFYFEFDLSPPMRPLVKHIKTNFGAEIGNSIWLMKRYGESPARSTGTPGWPAKTQKLLIKTAYKGDCNE